MREILYKGFSICAGGPDVAYIENELVRGYWVQGFVFEYHEVGTCIGTEPLSANDYGEICRDCYDVIDPATLCQYTGLTDKNGVKIFEKDLVISPYIDPIFKSTYSNGELKCLNTRPLPIVFLLGTFCVDYNEEDKGIIALNAFNTEKDIEIIGSIHDTPEPIGQADTPHDEYNQRDRTT